MTYDEYKRVKVGSQCVISWSGDPGTVTAINAKTSDIQLAAKRCGMGMTRLWYHYTQLGKL